VTTRLALTLMNVKRMLTDAVMTVSTRRGLTTALVQVDMNSLVTTRLALTLMNVKRMLTDAVMTVSTRRGLTTALVQVDTRYELISDNKTCTNIDECEKNVDGCRAHQ
jgi:hypothetical protein